MRRIIFGLTACLAVIFVSKLFFGSLNYVRAQQSQDLQAVENQIQELKNKLRDIQNQKNTLSNKIAYYDNQIALTTLQIEQTTLQIATLSARISNLEGRLDHLSTVFVERTVQSYRTSPELDPINIFFASGDFGGFVEGMNYLKAIQLSDHQLMVQLEETRTNYEGQQTLAELLAQKQQQQKDTLNQQRKESAFLLEKYKNDEKTYQKQLDSALAEQAAMEAAQANASQLLQNGSPVDKGTVIAQIGNTGYPVCSTGTHLHFEIDKDGVAVNPATYLKDESVTWDNQPDSSFSFTGSWDWPIDNPRVEQGFGQTYWAKLGWYKSGIHSGIDMISDTSSLIRTPVSGTLYKGASSCGSVPIKFAAVDAGGGVVVWFWHVQ